MNVSNFVASAIVVVCVLAPLVLLGFILHSALAEKPGKKKDDPP